MDIVAGIIQTNIKLVPCGVGVKCHRYGSKDFHF